MKLTGNRDRACRLDVRHDLPSRTIYGLADAIVFVDAIALYFHGLVLMAAQETLLDVSSSA